MYYIMLYSFNLHNLGSSFFFMKQARKEDIHTFESKFFISSQRTFLNYNIFHKLFHQIKKFQLFCDCYFVNFAKIPMKLDWNYVCLKNFNSKLVRNFWGTMSHLELATFGSCFEINCEVKICFYLLIFSVFWRTILTIFLHCLFVDDEKLCQKA